jgi:uncharacterized membrane protein YgcG
MIKKLSLTVIFILIVTSVFTLSVSASSDESRILDTAGIISEDKAKIETALSDFESECGIPIRLVTTLGNNSYDLSELGFVYGENLIVLEINYYHYTDTYYYYLDTFGDAYYEITDSEVDRILDASAVYDNIKGGRFGDGISAFTSLASKAYIGKLQEPVWNTLLVSFILALVTGGITVGCVIYRYKRKLKSPTYPLDRYASLNLSRDECSDIFIGSTVSKVRINTSSARSGGGSRGGSGGGRRGGR